MRSILTLCCVLMMHICWSCDFCGSYMGITPYDNQSNISLLYRYRSFNGYGYTNQEHQLFPQRQPTATNSSSRATTNFKHGGSTENEPVYSQNDYEVYTTAELRADYFIHKRADLKLIIPFVMNTARTNAEMQTVHSLGDITLLGAYTIIDKTLTEKYQHRLILGGGIKLPTGNYKAVSEDGDRIDPLLQTGTGTIDGLSYLNYIFCYKKLGLNFNSTCKFNGKNNYDERNGVASTNYLNLFFKFRSDKDFKIFPSIQGYYEYSDGLFINDSYQNGTTINVAMAGVGLDLFYKHLSLNTSFQMPVYEDVMPTNLSSAGKFMIGITYGFNQLKYLLK